MDRAAAPLPPRAWISDAKEEADTEMNHNPVAWMETEGKVSADRAEAERIQNGKSWIENAREMRVSEWNRLLDGLRGYPLWKKDIPGFHPEYGQRPPAIYPYPALRDRPAGAILISAGGGHLFKSEWEAEPVARRFYDMGFATFIVDYRVRPYDAGVSALDAIRSVRFLRFHAEALKVLPDKICVLGGSAGGQQSALASTRFTYGDPEAEDPVERVSSRPDACVISYGTFSRTSRLGAPATAFDWEAQRAAVKLSPDRNLRTDCPPFFIWQTNADDPRHGTDFVHALTDYGIPCEFHLFAEGPHGGGLYDGKHRFAPYCRGTSRWPLLAGEFLENLGFLPEGCER